MSFLDDYQVHYKLLGVRLVSDMFTCVPPQLLLRTGVDTLIFNVRSTFMFTICISLRHFHFSLSLILCYTSETSQRQT